MLEKKKLRDIAESISGIRPENRSLEGIVSFIEEQAEITYEKQPRTFLGRLRELGYALNGVRPTQRSLRGIVNNIYENFSPVPPVPPVLNKIYGVSGMFNSSTSLTRTGDAVGMTYTKNLDGTITSDFDDVFPYNEMKRETINGNVFVKIPAMWFRVGVDSGKNITDIAVSKEKGVGNNWYQTKEFYYSAYLGSVSGTKLKSVTNKNPNQTIGYYIFHDYAKNNGQYYTQLDLYHRTITFFLFAIEFATKDSSSLFSTQTIGGKTGLTDNISTPSGILEDGRMKWRGIEDFVGSLDCYIEGVDDNYFATSDISKYGEDYTNFNELSYRCSYEQVYNNVVQSIGWDSNNPFLVMPLNVKELEIGESKEQYFGTSNYAYRVQIDSPQVYVSGRMCGAFGYYNMYKENEVSVGGTGARLLYCPNGV